MHIMVMGAGVVGVTTAFLLAQDGHAVTVIDKDTKVAAQASHANGGQLSYDFASPMATPGLLKKIPHILSGGDLAFRIRPELNMRFLTWSLQFLHNCSPTKAEKNEQDLTRLSQRSGEVLQHMLKDIDFDFSYRKAGKLVVYEKQPDFDHARASLEKNRGNGTRFRALGRDECLAVEPALQNHKGRIVGGVYASLDDVGDAAVFTSELAQLCQDEYGVEFLLGEAVTDVIRSSDKVTGLATDHHQTYGADAFICCLGSDENRLLERLGIRLPIYPIKGYSLTLPPGDHVPKIAITDAQRKLVYSRLGDQVRIAGFADFGFKDATHDRRRIEMLRNTARASFPGLANFDDPGKEWTGLRPSTPTSLPVVRQSRYQNLYLNMGHGMFGWTLAAATGQAVADSFISMQSKNEIKVEDAA